MRLARDDSVRCRSRVSYLGWSVFPEGAALGVGEPLKGELTAPPVIHWEGVCGCGSSQKCF